MHSHINMAVGTSVSCLPDTVQFLLGNNVFNKLAISQELGWVNTRIAVFAALHQMLNILLSWLVPKVLRPFVYEDIKALHSLQWKIIKHKALLCAGRIHTLSMNINYWVCSEGHDVVIMLKSLLVHFFIIAVCRE